MDIAAYLEALIALLSLGCVPLETTLVIQESTLLHLWACPGPTPAGPLMETLREMLRVSEEVVAEDPA